MYKLYILSPSAFQQNSIPQYDLFIWCNHELTYIGQGPRLSVEHCKKLISTISDSQIIEINDVSNDSFIRIMRSNGTNSVK